MVGYATLSVASAHPRYLDSRWNHARLGRRTLYRRIVVLTPELEPNAPRCPIGEPLFLQPLRQGFRRTPGGVTNQPLTHPVHPSRWHRLHVALVHARTPRLKLANTSPARLRPVDVSRYSRRRGRPALEGSIDSHWLTNQPADSSLRRIGYRVPDAMPQRRCTSAPDSCSVGFSRNASSTFKV